MLRTIVGFAVFAVVALVVLKVALALIGTFIGLAVTVLCLAALGFGLYLLLTVVSPATARRVRAAATGRPGAP
ncbi:MAG TPA: hypothetical protein VN848_13120 [Gemmatimonadales bacterium]|nr:hypothetical protein [Gemmatimonadales bacterium]